MKELEGMGMIRVIFDLPDGSTLERTWSLGDFTRSEQKGGTEYALPVWLTSKPPEWIEEPSRTWEHPQDPITFRGRIKPGYEDRARALLDATGTAE